VITPRTTRLVRVADLRSFRSILAALATEGSPFDTRNRLVVVPTRAAAHHLLRSIEDRLHGPAAMVLPDMVTRAELHDRLFQRVPQHVPSLTLQEREALLGVACSAAVDAGVKPPFRIRPGLVGAMLEFFDSLKRYQKSVDAFERLALGKLDGGAEHDRGAERLVRQTRFLAAAFREFERRCAEAGGVDEHVIRERLLDTEVHRPWRHVIVAVRDRAAGRYGLYPVDWDLLARLPELRRVDVVVTDATLAGSFHERIHQWLPGIEEVRAEGIVTQDRSVRPFDVIIFGTGFQGGYLLSPLRVIGRNRADNLDPNVLEGEQRDHHGRERDDDQRTRQPGRHSGQREQQHHQDNAVEQTTPEAASPDRGVVGKGCP